MPRGSSLRRRKIITPSTTAGRRKKTVRFSMMPVSWPMRASHRSVERNAKAMRAGIGASGSHSQRIGLRSFLCSGGAIVGSIQRLSDRVAASRQVEPTVTARRAIVKRALRAFGR